MSAPAEPCNPFASLDVTDRAELPGGVVEQRLELLVAHLGDGARLKLSRNLTGAVQIQVDAQGARVLIALEPELALRAGSHMAGLACASLEPEAPAA